MKKIGLWTIWLSGTLMMFVMPVYQLYLGLFKGQATKVKYSLITALILFALFVIMSKYALKLMDRKLDAIETAKQLNKVPKTNFIIIRILKTLEIMLPIAIVTMIIYGLTQVNIKIPPHLVFRDILVSMFIGFILYLIHDILNDRYVKLKSVKDAAQERKLVDRQIEREYIKAEKKRLRHFK